MIKAGHLIHNNKRENIKYVWRQGLASSLVDGKIRALLADGSNSLMEAQE